MCACVHIDIIQLRLEQALPINTCSTIDKIQHTFSAALFDELHTRLGKLPLYQQWIQALLSQRRIRILSSANEATYPFPAGHPLIQYVIASFYGQQRHVRNYEAADVAQLEILRSFGITVLKPAQIETLRCDPNPIYQITFTKQTRHAPALLRDYFAKETRIVVYDKYLNGNAAAALATFAPVISQGATVTIFTHPVEVAGGGQICRQAMQKANASLVIDVLGASHNTLAEVHDRHVFIGDRYHLRFTSGIGVFGKLMATTFFNEEGAVYVYDVFEDHRPLTLTDVGGRKFYQRVSACA